MLAALLRDEKTISWYEVHMSRLVPVLLHCLTGSTRSGGREEGPAGEEGQQGSLGVLRAKKAKERVKLFKKTFVEASDEVPVDLDSR